MTFKKLLWRLQYTWYMNKKSSMGYVYCWESSGISLEEDLENLNFSASTSVDDEMSYWND